MSNINFTAIWDFIVTYIGPHVTDVIRIGVAMAIGLFLGKERGHQQRPAGARTNAIVCVSSCLVMLIGEHLVATYPGIDPSRLAAQVISGIGFLGAGAILKSGFTVRGLTTAATLWGVACIGLAVGAGFYVGAVTATIAIIVSLQRVGSVDIRRSVKSLYLNVDSLDETVGIAKEEVERFGGQVSSVGFDSSVEELVVKMVIKVDNASIADLTAALLQHKGINAAYFS